MTELVLIIMLVFVGLMSLPWMLYLGAKLAGYGWLRGRQLYNEDRMKEAKHGDE